MTRRKKRWKLPPWLRWFGPAVDSVKGHVNAHELHRSFFLAVATGGGIDGFLLAIQRDLPRWIDRDSVAIGGAILTLILEVRRRLGHGQEILGQGPFRPPEPSHPHVEQLVKIRIEVVPPDASSRLKVSEAPPCPTPTESPARSSAT
jgi:hypothetical protein